MEGTRGRTRGCGATHCYGCACDTCANSVELLSWYVTIGEAVEPCFSCDDCRHYDGDLRKRNTAAGAHDAAARWCQKYEIPANTAATAEARGALARDTYWPKYSGTGAAATKPTAPASTKVVPAEKFDRSLAGTYIVTPNIGANVRLGPSTDHGIIKAVSKGTKASNYGYYSIRGGVKWYYVRIGATVGFISSTCLKKI